MLFDNNNNNFFEVYLMCGYHFLIIHTARPYITITMQILLTNCLGLNGSSSTDQISWVQN